MLLDFKVSTLWKNYKFLFGYFPNLHDFLDSTISLCPTLTHLFAYVIKFVLLCSLRYAFPWWKEKEIVSDEKRSQGLCPLTPEEATLILQALGIEKGMQIYIASGDIYGSERRLAALRTAFPNIGSVNCFVIPFFLGPSQRL